MTLKVTAEEVAMIAPGMFHLTMAPHRVRSFGSNAPAHGSRSILLIQECEYDEKHKRLTFDLDATFALNVGTSPTVLAISATHEAEVGRSENKRPSDERYGPGDLQFLRMAADELSPEMALVAEKILSGVREKVPGALKKGQSRNFSETPDNFWYVIVQPRVDELSITVRGPVKHFYGFTNLEVKDDRGNTRFKVRSIDDVQAALKLIFHAIRKR